MTPEQIKEARDWLDTLTGYTPGPWRVSYERGTTQIRSADNDSLMCDETYYPWVPDNQNDWTIIAAAPALRDRYAAALDEIERLRDALEECQREIDDYIRQEYPLDHPVHERYRKRDFSANPARIALKGQDQ